MEHGTPPDSLAHARAGGGAAEPVVRYLEAAGDADIKSASAPLDEVDRDAVVGRYVYGSGPRDLFDVAIRNNQLGIERPGTTRRSLIHLGGGVFFPSGVPSVKISFLKTGSQASQLTIADPDVLLVARRA